MNARRMRGLSLVEMLAALFAASLLSAGLLQVFVLEQQDWRAQDSAARQQDNARVALELLAREIRGADAWGGIEAAAIITAPGLRLSGRSGAFACSGSWLQDSSMAVQGFEGASRPPFDCLSASDYVANSDMLALKAADADGLLSGKPSGSASSVWLRVLAGGSGYLFALGDWSSAQAALSGSAAYQLPYKVSVFALRPCSVQNSSGHCSASSDGAQPLPTLIALQLTSAGALEERPLVENIEQLQFEYGLDSDGDQRLDRYANASAISDWSRVLTVRVGLIARGDVRRTRRDLRAYELPGGYRFQASSEAQLWPRRLYLREVAIRKRQRP